MSRPVYIRKGTSEYVKSFQNNSAYFGNNYHFVKKDEYVLYDWIQNTSPAYINTGINPRGEWKYELKLKITDYNTLGTWYPVAGTTTFYPSPRVTSSTGDCGIWFNKNNRNTQTLRYYYNRTIEQLQTSFYLNVGDIMIYTNDVYGKFLKVERITSSGSSSTSQKNCSLTVPSGEMIPYPIYLFSKNDEGLLDTDRKGATYPCKIYYFKIFDGATGQLVHNFLPAVSNDVHGMVDIVTKKFYTNANSGGTLTCGND